VSSKPFFRAALVVLALGVGVSTANADSIRVRVLTFDDLGSARDLPAVPNGYGGLSWSKFDLENFAYMPPTVGSDSGYLHGTISAPNVAFNDSGNPASFGAKTPFNFVSAFLTPAWSDDLHVTVQGFANDQLKYSETLVLPSTTNPNLVMFNFLNVDRVRFESFGGTNVVAGGNGTQFAMDNVSIGGVAPTPEPASLLLFMTGVAAEVFRRRRERA